MKVEWQTSDLKGGRRLGKSGRKEQWMIGYQPNINGGDNWCLVSLVDGMIAHSKLSSPELVVVLNRFDYIPIELLPENTR